MAHAAVELMFMALSDVMPLKNRDVLKLIHNALAFNYYEDNSHLYERSLPNKSIKSCTWKEEDIEFIVSIIM